MSGDEDTVATPPRQSSNHSLEKSRTVSKPKIKRPRILKRKGSRNINLGRDWGERCVDDFEVIIQIGEGKLYFIILHIF